MIVYSQTLRALLRPVSLQGYLIRFADATLDECSQKISIRGGKTCTQLQDEVTAAPCVQNTYR